MPKYKSPVNGCNFIVVNGAFTFGSKRTARIVRRAAKVADVMLMCEVKWVNVHEILDPKVWEVIQFVGEGDGKAGSCIAVRRDKVTIHRSGIALGTDNHGVKMNDRYFVWANVSIKGRRGRRIRLIAGHMPPKRYGHLWPNMADSLRRLVARAAKRPVIAGADWNQDERRVEDATGLEWRGVHILGLAYSPRLEFSRARALSLGGDHEFPHATLRY